MLTSRIWWLPVMGWLLVSPSLAQAQEPYFPDPVFFPRDKELNAIVVDHLSVHLKAMKEPSLWKVSQDDRTATVYRFLWLANFEHPICVRITKSGGAYSLHVARHDGSPGLTAGRITINKDVKLSAKQWEGLISRLEKTKFWVAPPEVKESRGIADGDKIVIEGIKGGRYHVVDRAGSTTGEAYKGFCRHLLELAQPDMLKSWDHFREDERKTDYYRPEPSETEDHGGPEPPDKEDQIEPTEP